MHQSWRLVFAFIIAVGTLGMCLATLDGFATGAWPLSAAVSQAERGPAAPLDAVAVSLKGEDSVFAGDRLTYTLLVTNTSGGDLDGVVVFDTWVTNLTPEIDDKLWGYGVLPAFEGFVAEPSNLISQAIQTVDEVGYNGEATWWLKTLPAGQSVEIEFWLRVPITVQPSLKSYDNYPFSFSYKEIGPSTVDNSVSVALGGQQSVSSEPLSAQIVAPLLEVTKKAFGESAGDEQCRVGRLVTYTIVIDNLSQEEADRPDVWPARHVVVKDTLPDGYDGVLEYIPDSSGAYDSDHPNLDVSVVYTPATYEIQWTLPSTYTLGTGETLTVTFVGRVPVDIIYNPKTRGELKNDAENVRVSCDGVMFRPATLAKDHDVKILSPVDKAVQTESPPVDPYVSYPNRMITYTLTYYNPLSQTTIVTIEDHLPLHFSYVGPVTGDILTPTKITGTLVQWSSIPVGAYESISTVFQVFISSQTPVEDRCKPLEYPNSVIAYSPQFPVPYYDGHDDNELAPIDVAPQLMVKKTVQPSTQIFGELITYTISIDNEGNTPINPPLVITDALSAFFQYEAMVSSFPGEPVVSGNLITGTFLRWDDVLSTTLSPGGHVEFSFLVRAGMSGKQIPNYVYGYHAATSVCTNNVKINITPPIGYDKKVVPEQVVQGDMVTYTVWLNNISPSLPFTLTAFADLLDKPDSASNTYKGLKDPADGDTMYEYTLPTPFRLEPNRATSWTHTFPVTMSGYGLGHTWCDMLAEPDDGVIEQRGSDILGMLDNGVWGSGAYNTKLAPVCVFPHVSLFQKSYPNPVAVGEVFSIVVSLRNNRFEPDAGVTGVDLQWFPAQAKGDAGPFEILSSEPPPDTTSDNPENGIYYMWEGLEIPPGETLAFTLTLQAPTYDKPGDKETYSKEFIAQVVALDDVETICIPKVTKFVVTDELPVTCDEKVEPLVLNQGIEVSKPADPQRVGPFGEVQYTLELANLTGAPAYNVVYTDILPQKDAGGGNVLAWEYLRVIDGPEPVSESPLVWEFDVISPLEQVEIVFTARAHGWLSLNALNSWEASATMNVNYSKNYTDDAKVEVVPGIGFFKVVDPEYINAGEATTYTLTLYNGSGAELSNLVFTDTIPNGFSFVSTSQPAGLTPAGESNDLVWEVPGPIDDGASYLITYKVQSDANMFSGEYPSQLAGQAEKEGQGLIELSATDFTAPVNVRGRPKVEVAKTVDPQAVMAGEDVIYRITLENDTDTTYPLIVTDTLPAGFTLVGGLSAPFPGSVVERDGQQLVVWEGEGMSISPKGQAGDTIELLFKAHSNREIASGNYFNSVQVEMGEVVLPPVENLARVEVTELPRVDAQVSKSNGLDWVSEGEALEYTIYYTNASLEAKTFETIILTETIFPADYLTVLSPESAWHSLGGGRYTRTITTPLVAGDSGSTVFQIQLDESIPMDYLGIRNKVEIGYTLAEDAVEASHSDNTAEDVDLISGREIVTVTKTVSPDRVRAGDQVVYTISLRLMDGIMDNYTVRVTDTLPSDISLDKVLSPPGGAAFPGGVAWPAVLLEPGKTVQLVFRAQVSPFATSGVRLNKVQVKVGEFDMPLHGGLAPVDVLPTPKVDVQVSKDDGETLVSPGQWITYTIHYTNAYAGGSGLQSVILTETVDPGRYVQVLDSAWQEIGTGRYRRVIAYPTPLAAGKADFVKFPVRIDPSIPGVGSIINQVDVGFITLDNAVDVDPSNNSDQDIDALEVSGIQVSKSVTPTHVTAGEEVVYSIQLVNNDSVSYSNVRVTDTLPVNFTFIAPTSDVETPFMSGDRQVVVWKPFNIGAEESRTLTFRAKVDRLAPDGADYCNTVAVTGQSPVEETACVDVSGLSKVEVQVSKDDGVVWLDPGMTLNYTIRYTNTSASDLPLESVVLTDTITPRLYVTPLAWEDWTEVSDGVFVFVDNVPLAVGASRSVTFGIQLASSIPTDTVRSVLNTVSMGYVTGQESAESDMTDNQDEDHDYFIAPDLVITNVRWEPSAPIANEPLWAYITIENQGNMAVDRNWNGDTGYIAIVEAYLKEGSNTPPSSVGDHYGSICIAWITSLEAGESREYSCDGYAPGAGTYRTYGQADVTWFGADPPFGKPFGMIEEAIETNNIFAGNVLQIPHVVYLPLIIKGG
ncbi:MAG: DUF11 domain-containing protein [Anaerolineae bacterium]|nr:DUF11 domain-containing protein [Anaerolineae bacterium]